MEKFNIAWDAFESNACSTFKNHFTDVTLACEDNK